MESRLKQEKPPGQPGGLKAFWQGVHDAFHAQESRVYVITQGIVWFLIAFSVAIFIIEIAIGTPWAEEGLMHTIDTVVLWIFGLEILLRIASFHPPQLDYFKQTKASRLRTHLMGRLKYCGKPMVIIDMLTVLALVPEFRGLRAIRLFRLIRTGDLFPYSKLFQAVGRAFADNYLLYTVALSLLGVEVVVGGVSVYLAEAQVNPAISTLGDGLWWAVVTITTVGFGDIAPMTGVGRILGGVLMIGGMFTLALFAGIVGTTMLNSMMRLREEQLRMLNTIGHIVVCGYDAGSRMLLDALVRETTPETELVIFSGGERPGDVPPRFRWVPGDPTKESEMDKVDLVGAATVIVVGARDVNPQMADARSILTVFTLRSYLGKQDEYNRRLKPVHIICEVLDAENVGHAKASGANEVIESSRLGFALMAHTATAPGTSRMLTLVASRDGHSLHDCKVSSLGPDTNTFGRAARALRTEFGALAIGIRTGNELKNTLNPPDSTPLGPDDHLVYLADKPVISED